MSITKATCGSVHFLEPGTRRVRSDGRQLICSENIGRRHVSPWALTASMTTPATAQGVDTTLPKMSIKGTSVAVENAMPSSEGR